MKGMALAGSMLVAILLPIGTGPGVNAAGAARSVRAAPTCRNTQLVVRAYTSQGAAGHIAIVYRIHNQRGLACSLVGYPGVQLLNRRFHSLPTTVVRGPGNLVGAIPVRVIRLPAHGNAYFAMGYSDVPAGRPCQAPAYYLMVWAPNDYLPVVTAAVPHGSITSCTGVINVSPVTAHPRYQ